MPRRYAKGVVIGRIGLRIRNSNFSGTRDELLVATDLTF